MILAIDAGNSNVVYGLYGEGSLRGAWRTRTDRDATADDLALTLQGMLGFAGASFDDVTGVAVAPVVAPLRRVLLECIDRYIGVQPVIAGPTATGGLRLDVERPEQLGADRIANAVAARQLFGRGAIVVDLGTATTFDVVSADGAFRGGAIAPGLKVAVDALYARAPALPRAPLQPPDTAVGRSTRAALQSGIVLGYAGLIDGLVERLRSEVGADAPVVATGGLASVVAGEARSVDRIDPLLTLTGLRLIYEHAIATRTVGR